MLKEPGVLRGHKGQDQVPGQAAVRHLDALFRVKFPDEAAVPGKDLGDHRGPEFLDGGEVRQVPDKVVVDIAPHPRARQQAVVNQAVKQPGPSAGPSAAADDISPTGPGWF